MDGPAHYREAERLLAAARTASDHFYGEEDAIPTLQAAQVHATLAHAAATALGSAALDGRAWADVAGTKLSG